MLVQLDHQVHQVRTEAQDQQGLLEILDKTVKAVVQESLDQLVHLGQLDPMELLVHPD